MDFDEVDPEKLITSDYSENSTLVKAYFCMLALKEPLYLKNGEKIKLENPAIVLDKKHKHHIFPKKILAKVGFKARKYNSIMNICYLALQENVGIQSKVPHEYLQEHRSNKSFKKIMESHLIPCSKRSSIWQKDIKKAFPVFLKERMKEVVDAFEKTGGKVFEPFESMTKS